MTTIDKKPASLACSISKLLQHQLSIAKNFDVELKKLEWNAILDFSTYVKIHACGIEEEIMNRRGYKETDSNDVWYASSAELSRKVEFAIKLNNELRERGHEAVINLCDHFEIEIPEEFTALALDLLGTWKFEWKNIKGNIWEISFREQETPVTKKNYDNEDEFI